MEIGRVFAGSGSGGQGAQCLLLRHARSPMPGVVFRPSLPQARILTQLDPLSCKPGNSSTRLCASASSLAANSSTADASAAAAAAAAGASSANNRAGFLSWYLDMLEINPIWTKGITTALIFAAADVCSQLGTRTSSSKYDFVRTLRMACYGMIILGPALHCWFNLISTVLPKCDLASTLMKIAIGQITFAPFITSVFFSTNALAQGESGREIIARLKRDLIPTMLRGFSYWPLCDFITFRFIPVALQPLTSSLFSFFWTIYLTYMASRKKVVVRKDSTI